MAPNKEKDINDLPAPIQRIRAKMQVQHISQQELGDRLHMSSSAISRLMQGETTLTFETAVQISQHLHITLDEIAGHDFSSEHKSVDALVSLYEDRLNGLRNVHANLVSELKSAHTHELDTLRERYDERQQILIQQYEVRIFDLIRDRKIMRIVLAVLLAIFLGIVIADLSIGTRGWVQYGLAPVLDGVRNFFSTRT